jgi:hypothetical protein
VRPPVEAGSATISSHTAEPLTCEDVPREAVWALAHDGTTRRAEDTGRSEPSEGRLMTRPRTTIVVEPPPSRLRAHLAPSDLKRYAKPRSVIPRL